MVSKRRSMTIFAKETKIITTMTFNYDVIVVGAGHAGCEAGISAGRQPGFENASYHYGHEQDCTDELAIRPLAVSLRTDRP